MIRTNMYFPKQLYYALKSHAREQGISVAELVRRFVKNAIEEKKKSRNPAEMFLRMAASAKRSGYKDLASNHDRYLYGDKRIK